MSAGFKWKKRVSSVCNVLADNTSNKYESLVSVLKLKLCMQLERLVKSFTKVFENVFEAMKCQVNNFQFVELRIL